MTYTLGTHYHKSYVFKESLTTEEYFSLSADDDVVGIWEIPQVIYQIPKLTETTMNVNLYGDMSDAMQETKTQALIDEGYAGANTIIVIIDDFPDAETFFDYLPYAWYERILHYPTDYHSGSGMHGIMTAGIAGYVSPESKLYLIEMNDPLSAFEEVLTIKETYSNYDIVCSNSYVFDASAYYYPEHPVNRKIRETANEDIIVVFGAGNWGKEGEHNPSWTLDGGYDARRDMFPIGSEIGYPAVFDEIISVAGCNAYCDKILSYSSLGRGVDDHDEPDVSAPTHHYFPYSPYDALTLGTSASTPFMAGICANILSGRDVDTQRMIGAIRAYSKDAGETGYDKEFGFGIVDATAIFENYYVWIPPVEQSMDLYLYVISIGMLGIGIVFNKKEELLNIIG